MLDKIRRILDTKSDRDSFFKVVERYYPKGSDDFVLIERGYSTAENAFEEVKRESGDRYFEHLIGVALILMVYLRIRDPNTIVAALLHDIVEDIAGWENEDLAMKFGSVVAEDVWWVTKPPVSRFDNNKQARNRAYHQNLTRAPRRAILVKLADRLHNLLTLWDVPLEKQMRKVAETQDYYLPIAESQIILIHEIESAMAEIQESWETPK